MRRPRTHLALFQKLCAYTSLRRSAGAALELEHGAVVGDQYFVHQPRSLGALTKALACRRAMIERLNMDGHNPTRRQRDAAYNLVWGHEDRPPNIQPRASGHENDYRWLDSGDRFRHRWCQDRIATDIHR